MCAPVWRCALKPRIPLALLPPLWAKRRRKRKMDDKPLSVGIAAGCEYGRYAVVASDGTLSFGQQAADVEAPKMTFYAGWTFIFAGKLGSTQQIFEEIRQAVHNANSIEPLSRERIQDTTREAYSKRVEKWNAIRHLAGFGLTMPQFL